MAVDRNVVDDFDGLWSQPLCKNWSFTEAFDEIELPIHCTWKDHRNTNWCNTHNNSDLSTDSDSDNDVEVSSSDSSEEIENSDTDGHSLDSPDESETNGSQEKTLIFLPKNMPVWLFWP